MKFFIDTANIEEIKKANGLGILDGVTTNPTLIAREEMDFQELLKDICSIVNGPISAEVISLRTEEMVEEARKLSKLAPNIIVKIPITKEGLKATKILNMENIKVNMTLIFSANQALLAAKSGASYVSPFIGRLDDIGHEGMNLVREIITIFNNYNIKTEVIVASIRHPLHVIEAAKAGAHVATIPFNVIEKMIVHPLTDIGIRQFLNDWEKGNVK
ncbi:fructose-6-phosphate aldolase [Halobacteriota archaeon]